MSKTEKKTSSKEKANLNLKIDKEKAQKFLKSAGKVVALLLVLLLVDLFVQYLNNDYSVAIVNGQRISKSEYTKNLETMYGAQIADALIEEEIVKQLGEEKDITVEEDELNEAYDEIAEQIGGADALEDALASNSMTADELREQLKTELVLKAIIAPTLEYTDEDLGAFFEEYKDLIYPDTTDVTFEGKRDEVEEYYIEQKTYESRDVILADFRKDSSIQINVPGAGEDEVKYGMFKATRNLISNFIERYNVND